MEFLTKVKRLLAFNVTLLVITFVYFSGPSVEFWVFFLLLLSCIFNAVTRFFKLLFTLIFLKDEFLKSCTQVQP